MLTLVACLSQNLIPVHIAYIPILVPPLLRMMNRMRLTGVPLRALAFGHKARYITIPFGFGIDFSPSVIAITAKTVFLVTVKDVTAANWSIGAVPIGLFTSRFGPVPQAAHASH